jgi:hypothetical protein
MVEAAVVAVTSAAAGVAVAALATAPAVVAEATADARDRHGRSRKGVTRNQ